MNKKTMEIVLSIGSVLMFIVMLIFVHLAEIEPQGYGFTAALMLFVLAVSLAGIKITRID
ncbi:hypothetical protein SAMN04488587_0119 [Methanococcoides vulcani]|uniref:Uncharacterized protein n=1 Tax=Methanococcoides vulcani TaxID=1353158 RepID=A0A1H9Y177_9EURY|nr:hypothetical protein [Methanococcoides vulcani]SES62462.1 hypothetical protein SAMN04488587_0119 [Methanococcoides vulcani]